MEGEVEVSRPQGWGQLPPEVLGIIFSHLQRKRDLLNGRLVCRSWNGECLRLLEKSESEFHQILTESNINRYIDILNNGDCLAELKSLPFHLNINLNIANSEDTCYKMKLNKLTENVKSLCDRFGRECVTKFTLSTPSRANFPSEFDSTRFWIIQILAMISPGLKVLDLSDFSLRLGYYTEDEIKSTELCDLNFPKLVTLTCSKWKFAPHEFQNFGRSSSGTTYAIYPYIIDRSPNMENLEQIDAEELIGVSVNYDKLGTLLVDGYGVIREPSQILQKFLQSSSPKLRKFAISLAGYSIPDSRTVLIHNILELISSTLKSLTVTTMETDDSHPFYYGYGTSTAPLMRFPRLLNLQHLRLNVRMCRRSEHDWIIFNPEDINLNPENLPSLKSVELPLGFILCEQTEWNPCLRVEFGTPPVIFSTVNELTIRINRTRHWSQWLDQKGVYKGEGALKHLQKLFPNVSKLSILNESKEVQWQYEMQSLFKFLIQSPLSTSIQEVCFQGFDEDFLGQVLAQMNAIPRGVPPNSFFLTNIRIIRLRLSKLAHITYQPHDPFPHLRFPVPNLTAIAEYFPLLQIIEISELLFRGMSDTERKELIQTFATRFPYVTVQVTNHVLDLTAKANDSELLFRGEVEEDDEEDDEWA